MSTCERDLRKAKKWAHELLIEANVRMRLDHSPVTRRLKDAAKLAISEFQQLGLVDVVDNDDDARTRRLVPTDKFIKRLNHHLYLFKKLCHNRYLMVDKA